MMSSSEEEELLLLLALSCKRKGRHLLAWSSSSDISLHVSAFSILCLTTDPTHQGHEKRKKSVTSARSPRNTSAQLRDRKVWEAVTSRFLGNGRSDASCKQYGGVSAWYKQFSVSASYKQYVSDECTSRQKHNKLSLLHAACLKLLFFFHKVLVLRMTCIVQEHVLPHFFN